MIQDNLPASDVRLRQQSCIVSMLDQEDVKSFNLEYNPQRRVTLSQIIKMDNEDESLRRYKKSILGDINEEHLKDNEPPEVEFLRMEIASANHKSIIVDLADLKANREKPFVIKQGEEYNIRIHFIVQNDCVLGLRFYNTVKRHHIVVDKYDEHMGSFAPTRKVHVVTLETQQAPTGFLSRGSYKGKAMFIDRDGICHMQFEYFFEIAKEWSD